MWANLRKLPTTVTLPELKSSLDDAYYTPPLLARQPPSVRFPALPILHEHETSLRTILSTIDKLQTHIDELRQHVTSRVARYVNARAPVFALPAEILRDIFVLAVNGDVKGNQPVILSHVCRSWRKECLSCRGLWTSVSLPMPSQCLELYKERSRDAKLDIVLRDDPRFTCGCSRCEQHYTSPRVGYTSPLSVHLLYTMVSRVRSITLNIKASGPSYNQSRVYWYLRYYPWRRFVSLENVILHAHPDDEDDIDSQTSPLRAPLHLLPTSLRSLSLVGVDVSLGDASLLTHLELSFREGDDFILAMEDVFSTCINLQSLVLRPLYGSPVTATHPVDAVHLRHLHKLSILNFGYGSTPAAFLKLIDAPDIRSLELRAEEEGEIDNGDHCLADELLRDVRNPPYF